MKKCSRNILAVLFPVFALGFVSHLVPYIYIPSLPRIAAYLGIGQSDTTTMMSAYYLSLSLALLAAGSVGDRWDKRLMLAGASTLIFIGAIAVPTVSSFYVALAGWAVQGIGAGVITVATQTWIGQSSGRHNVTSRFSYMSIILSLAPLVAPIAGGWITETWSWKCSFYVTGILTVASASLLYLALSPAPTATDSFSFRKILQDYSGLLSEAVFLPLIMASLVCFLFQGALMDYSSFLFISQLGLTPAVYGFISVPVVAGCITGSVLVMYIEKKSGIDTAFILNTVIAATALTASLLFYLITGTHTVAELASVILIFSIGFGGHTLLAIRNVMSVFTSRRSQGSALVNFLNQFAGYVAVLSVQFLFVFIGSAMTIHNMACAATVGMLTASTFLYLKTTRKQEIASL